MTADFVRESRRLLEGQTAVHIGTWHLDDVEEWSADQEAGSLVFRFGDGTVASALFQIVGTYDSAAGTFLWAWDHPSVLPSLRKDAQLAREWGAMNGIMEYTTRLVQCTEDRAWDFTAVAVRLAKANGAYRGPSGATYVFMTFGEIRLRKET